MFKPTMLTYKGETHSLSEWARRLNMSRHILSRRVNQYIRDGKKPEEALEAKEVPDEVRRRRLSDEMSELRAWRLAKGWTTAEEAGEYLGLSGSAVLMHERGDQPMSDTTKRLIDCIDRFGPLRPAALPKSIRTWRLKHGWSVEEAAEKLGIHPITVWKLEKYDEKSWRREGQLQRLMAYIDMEMANQQPPA